MPAFYTCTVSSRDVHSDVSRPSIYQKRNHTGIFRCIWVSGSIVSILGNTGIWVLHISRNINEYLGLAF